MIVVTVVYFGKKKKVISLTSRIKISVIMDISVYTVKGRLAC